MSIIDDIFGFFWPPPKPFQPKPPEQEPKKPDEPLPPAEKPTRSVRKTTLTGRVVYNRKRNFVNLGAAKRILRAYLTTDDGKPETTDRFLADLIEIYLVLSDITARYLGGKVASTILDLIGEIIKTLRKL